jgi:polyisoprenoid-binding protein YceI
MAIQQVWKIDVERSALRFSLRHKLLGEIAGQFRCWGGQVRIDLENPGKADVRIWVELSSIDTGSPSRDDEILRTELFDQRGEPALEFDGERLEVDASDHLRVVGWLGLHAFRKEIAVAVEDYALSAGASESPRFVCTARASVDRKALGLRRKRGVDHWLSDKLLGDTIDIAAHIEATLESAGASSSPPTLLALRSWAGARVPHAVA